MKKKQKGITLIALIITIVVLLIIAVVAIGTVKENKIISHTQNAASEYKIAQEKELIEIGYAEYLIEKNTSKNAQLKINGAQVSGSEDEGWKIVFSETNSEYQVDKNGDITYEESEKDKNNTGASIKIDDLIGKTFYGIITDSKQITIQIIDNLTVSAKEEDLASGTELQNLALPYEYKVEDGSLELIYSLVQENGESVTFNSRINAVTDDNGKIENLYFYAISEELQIYQFYSLNNYGITYDVPQTTLFRKNSEGDIKAKFVFNVDNKTVDYYSSIDSNGNFTSDYETKTYFIINDEIVINFGYTNMILKLEVEIIEDWFLQSDSIG